MQILVSFDRDHHAYGDTIAQAIASLRPSFDVSVAGSEALGAEFSRLSPDMVISDQPKRARSPAAWVQIPSSGDPVSRICVGGRCRSSPDLSLFELLAVVDEAEDLSV